MKQIQNNSKIILLSILILSLFTTNAQVLYEDQLETVYLNEQAEEVVYTNDFTSYNDQLITQGEINFGLKIKKAKESNSRLLFLSERSNLEILTSIYLKTLRKGANRSIDPQSFRSFLQERIPELMYQFEKDKNIKELYFLTRKNTFNGKIDALPSVI